MYRDSFVGTPSDSCTWEAYKSDYFSNGLARSQLDLVNGCEGEQQEILAHWLTDSLSLNGSVISPIVYEEKGPRELTDIFWSYERGCFLIESKTLSIFNRPQLPDRRRLKQNLSKGISKATSQLKGACKNLKRGLKVTGPGNEEIFFDRSPSNHCIILVPDLSLLGIEDGLGGDYLKEFSKECGSYLHILDLAALMRSVQHAHMLSENSKIGLHPTETFDAALLLRWDRAILAETPNIDFTMRVQ